MKGSENIIEKNNNEITLNDFIFDLNKKKLSYIYEIYFKDLNSRICSFKDITYILKKDYEKNKELFDSIVKEISEGKEHEISKENIEKLKNLKLEYFLYEKAIIKGNYLIIFNDEKYLIFPITEIKYLEMITYERIERIPLMFDIFSIIDTKYITKF